MILNPSMINAVVVNAADGASAEKANDKVDITLNLIYTNSDSEHPKIETISVKKGQTSISVDDLNKALNNRYKVDTTVNNKPFTIDTSKKEVTEKILVTVVPSPSGKEEKRTIKVQFKVGDNILPKTDEIKDVPSDITQIEKSKINAPEGYKLAGDQTFDIKNGIVEVNVVPALKIPITVNYTNKENAKDKIKSRIIPDVYENASSVNPKLVEIPKGYSIVPNQDFSIIDGKIAVTLTPNKKPGHSSSTDATTYTNKIQFIDQATNKEIGSMKVSGLNGSKHKLVIPEGYVLAKNESSEVKVDKSQKAYHVQVIKKGAVTTPAKPTITAHKTTFRTNKTTQLFNIEGKAVRNRALMANTSWAVDKQMTLNGTTYYRVATNEWAKVSDGAEDTYIAMEVFSKTITTSGNTPKRLYTSNGELIGNRALAPNTPWFSDNSLTKNGQTLYRVATNEWVRAEDLV
ncbi:hypothetical protein FD03_GL000946 [Companilactobacillus nodensis DSM 19682 = JCM 14932 = NBRC 107160]|uniref:S-layer protein C-terminal domain-containing protein n=2 Tax=Companilactobacillus nodensis TaxID=460870 RepID=A0A0R1KBH6_9LACO|nr:hypothetical protein FD03_GL000946 [Companilactobacillus nodensis DSM 19682 = JCM 14932 = NBRC 107160]